MESGGPATAAPLRKCAQSWYAQRSRAAAAGSEVSDTVLATQAFQNDPDLYLSAPYCRRVARRMSFTTFSAVIFEWSEFRLIINPSRVTMSQKLTLIQKECSPTYLCVNLVKSVHQKVINSINSIGAFRT